MWKIKTEFSESLRRQICHSQLWICSPINWQPITVKMGVRGEGGKGKQKRELGDSPKGERSVIKMRARGTERKRGSEHKTVIIWKRESRK